MSDSAATAGPTAAAPAATTSWYPRWYWPSFAAPASLFLVVFFLLFVTLLSVEWLLRRKWGLV